MTHWRGSKYKKLSVVGIENFESIRYMFRQIECFSVGEGILVPIKSFCIL